MSSAAASCISITAFGAALVDHASTSRSEKRRTRKCRQCQAGLQIKSAFFPGGARQWPGPEERPALPRQYHDSTAISCRFIPSAGVSPRVPARPRIAVPCRAITGGGRGGRAQLLCADMTDRPRALVRRGSFLPFGPLGGSALPRVTGAFALFRKQIERTARRYGSAVAFAPRPPIERAAPGITR